MAWWRDRDTSDEPRISAGEAMGLIGLGADPAVTGGLVHHRETGRFGRALMAAPEGAGGEALAEQWGLGDWADADVSDVWYPSPGPTSSGVEGAAGAWGWSS